MKTRTRNMMYEQQMQFLPTGSIDKLRDIIDKSICPYRYAIIIHDKDTDDKGNLVAPHVHVMMQFKNKRYLNAIAKILGDQPQYIQVWNDQVDVGFAYLVHRTKNSSNKYQYSPTDVIANFDFLAFLTAFESKSSKQSRNDQKGNVKQLLDKLYTNKIDREELEQSINGHEFGKYEREIKAVDAKRRQRLAEEFRQKMIEDGKATVVVWIYGKAGTGKSSLAQEIAHKHDTGDIYISGSTRDVFQSYCGEHTIILDDIRHYSLKYADLLRITDPYAVSVMAPSRYRDKYLAADMIIITCPYSPIDYYNAAMANCTDAAIHDPFDQIERRIATTICMDQNWIYPACFNPQKNKYDILTAKGILNPYSASGRQAQPRDEIAIFRKLVTD